MKKILLAGTLAFDEVTTPFGYSGKIPGGSATYLALAASLFKNESAIVSIAGYDFPKTFLQKFQERNVDISGIAFSRKHKSFYWKGLYYENMNRRDTLVTEVNALAHFEPLIPETYRDADFVVLGNLHPGIQKKILQQLESRPRLIMLDTMNFWMETTPKELKEVIGMIDVLLVNEEEARQLTGRYQLVHAAEKILRMGPSYVIIKQGEYGSVMFSHEGVFYAPAYPLETVMDPTGAGDSFAGGFIGHLSEYEKIDWEKMKNAVVCGSNVASFTVEDFGTKKLETLSREQLEERVKKYVRMTRFPLQNIMVYE